MVYRDKAKQAEYQRRYYERNKQHYRDMFAARRKLAKETILSLKRSNPCACGESHPACLDFHHRDPSTKTGDCADMVQNAWPVQRILDELDKCDVVCSNCHRKLHWNEDTLLSV